jgi:uncharacterized membrane protein YjjP (DUF1212 family)
VVGAAIRIAVKKRTLWLVVGFAALSGWAIAHLRDGLHLVLFACAMGLVGYLIGKFAKT